MRLVKYKPHNYNNFTIDNERKIFMKLKKILATIVCCALTIGSTAISASAADPVELKVYAQDTSVWELCEGADSLTITGDGTYSISADLKGYNLFATLYIKDVTGAAAPAGYENAVMTVDSIILNGSTGLELTQTEFPLANPDSGIIDVCFVNQWAETYVTNVELNGESYNFMDGGNIVDVNDVTINFTISGLGGEAAADDSAPASDSATETAATGNTGAAAVVSVMAVAGAAALVSRKRK